MWGTQRLAFCPVERHVFISKYLRTHKGERMKRKKRGNVSCTLVHKSNSTCSLWQVCINGRSQAFSFLGGSFQLLVALKIVNECKQNTRFKRKKRLGIHLHSRMVGGCVGGHTPESLQIYIKNTSVFLQAVFFIIRFVTSVSKSLVNLPFKVCLLLARNNTIKLPNVLRSWVWNPWSDGFPFWL